MGRDHSRRLSLIAFVVLAIALLAGTGLRVHAQQASPNIQHDEAWSYASASGRLGPFLAAMDGGLTGRWVPASEWQHFWQSDGLSDVGRIGPDLAANDVHPPLYFGLLHGWLAITGEHVWSGRALNLVFAALAVLAIFGLARALGFERLEGALVALVWAVSPAVVSVSSITRQYDLVALTTVLLVWGLVKACGAPPEQLEGERRPRTWLWLAVLWVAAATAAALLTHYQAVLLVAGGAFYVVAGFLLARRSGRRRPWWPPLLGLAAGTLAAALLAPGWSGAFGRERSKLEHFSTKVLVEKLDAIAQTLGRFVGGPVLIIAAAVVVVVVLLLIPRTRRSIVQRVRTARPGWWTILYFAVFTAGAIILQNVLFLSMPPRISARYLAMAWPFLAFLPLLFFGLWPQGSLRAHRGLLPAGAGPGRDRDSSAARRQGPDGPDGARRRRRRAGGQRRRRRAPALPLVRAGGRAGVRRHAGGVPRRPGRLEHRGPGRQGLLREHPPLRRQVPGPQRHPRRAASHARGHPGGDERVRVHLRDHAEGGAE